MMIWSFPLIMSGRYQIELLREAEGRWAATGERGVVVAARMSRV